VLRLYDRLNQKTAIQFVGYGLEMLPFRVEVIQTDNGSEFQAAFHWHILDKCIGHIYIEPMRPRFNGKVERSTGSTRRSSTVSSMVCNRRCVRLQREAPGDLSGDQMRRLAFTAAQAGADQIFQELRSELA
jgi:hypothetical protein